MPRAAKRKRRSHSPRPAESPQESRTAEAATALWVLTALNTLLCEIGWLGLRAYLRSHPGEAVLTTFTGMLLLVAVVLGVVVLVLTPIVYRVRIVAPPTTVTMVAIVIAIAPCAAILAIALSE